METGYIKLYRSLNNNEILANDNNAYVVFTRLLTLVDRRTGSYKTGRKKLAIYMNLKDRTLYDVLKRLQRASMLRLESNSYATTIYICNWSTYQQEPNRNPPTSRQQSNTKQEGEGEVVTKVTTARTLSVKEKELLDKLNAITNRTFKVLPKSAKDTLNQFTMDEIERALTKMVRHEWHKSKVSTLSSDYMLRPSTIDKFLSANDTAEQLEKSYGKPAARINQEKLGLSRKQLAELEYS